MAQRPITASGLWTIPMKGNADYNQKLSERRALAVRDYLVAQYDVAANRLEAIEYGINQLADPSKPLDAINQSVEISSHGKQND